MRQLRKRVLNWVTMHKICFANTHTHTKQNQKKNTKTKKRKKTARVRNSHCALHANSYDEPGRATFCQCYCCCSYVAALNCICQRLDAWEKAKPKRLGICVDVRSWEGAMQRCTGHKSDCIAAARQNMDTHAHSLTCIHAYIDNLSSSSTQVFQCELEFAALAGWPSERARLYGCMLRCVCVCMCECKMQLCERLC